PVNGNAFAAQSCNTRPPTGISGSRSVALILDVQRVTNAASVPEQAEFLSWVRATLSGSRDSPGQDVELTIRLVDAAESAALNAKYRGRGGATNVLSFPFEAPPGLDARTRAALPTLLGDLVICAPVVLFEAEDQQKPPAAHWAHMVVHGLLHLLGHDHTEPAEATGMEKLETAILRELGFPPPYEVPQGTHDERPI
ncbi:MAG: rRNA maturation RNase YbeY, partial [Thiohalocapsa sp.]